MFIGLLDHGSRDQVTHGSRARSRWSPGGAHNRLTTGERQEERWLLLSWTAAAAAAAGPPDHRMRSFCLSPFASVLLARLTPLPWSSFTIHRLSSYIRVLIYSFNLVLSAARVALCRGGQWGVLYVCKVRCTCLRARRRRRPLVEVSFCSAS